MADIIEKAEKKNRRMKSNCFSFTPSPHFHWMYCSDFVVIEKVRFLCHCFTNCRSFLIVGGALWFDPETNVVHQVLEGEVRIPAGLKKKERL